MRHLVCRDFNTATDVSPYRSLLSLSFITCSRSSDDRSHSATKNTDDVPEMRQDHLRSRSMS